MNRSIIYRMALERWGPNAQFGMLIEECAELIKAVNKFLRYHDEETVKNLAEEVADVEIMIEQIKHPFFINGDFSETVERAKDDKLFKLDLVLGAQTSGMLDDYDIILQAYKNVRRGRQGEKKAC